MNIALPDRLTSTRLFPFLATLGGAGPQPQSVSLDFGPLRRVSPAGLVTLAAAVDRWRRVEGRAVECRHLERCAITEYLQRMDLLRTCGEKREETFQRRTARGRFVPVHAVDHRVDDMADEMATCLAPGGEDYGHPLAGLHSLANYVLTETANNVVQHSGGQGFAAAQVNGKEGFVRLAIADNGNGILGSFRQAGLTGSEAWDDATATLEALKPRVSSKGPPVNQGVGLTLVTGLCRLMGGWALVVSGSGVVQMDAGGQPRASVLPDSGRFPGTLVAMSFPQGAAADFAALLQESKAQAGLLLRNVTRGNYTP